MRSVVVTVIDLKGRARMHETFALLIEIDLFYINNEYSIGEG